VDSSLFVSVSSSPSSNTVSGLPHTNAGDGNDLAEFDDGDGLLFGDRFKNAK
jgi:hypothetical protein